MNIKYLSDKQGDENVVALGCFDGIHKGHAKLILSAKKTAVALGVPLSIFTFASLPTKSHGDKKILSDSERSSLLTEMGVDRIYEFEFEKIKDMDAETFVNDVLIKNLHTRAAFCGETFRFGKNASYDKNDLSDQLSKHNKEAFFVKDELDENEKISSSAIKKLLTESKIKEANSLLYVPYFIESSVVHGRGVGKKLGFPTLNTEIDERKLPLKNGVYKTEIFCDGATYKSITNIGICPTFEERTLHAESFIFDFDGDLYGKKVRIYFLDFIREEVKFEFEEQLIEQVKKDIEIARID